MISKKISKILEEGRDNKVLVQWIDVTVYGEGKDNDDIEIDVEYSIHTKGYGHTEENHNLIWGSYFDDYKRAKGTFEYYSYDNDNFRDIVKYALDAAEEKNTNVVAIKLDNGKVITGKESELLSASSALLAS